MQNKQITVRLHPFGQFLLLFLLAGSIISSHAQLFAQKSEKLETLLKKEVAATVEKFSKEKVLPNEMAATLILLDQGKIKEVGSYRGDVPIYPASVVKLFYLEAIHQWMNEGKAKDTPELRRAMQDMIVESYNEATHYVVDILTGTTSGPELPEKEMEEWATKRNAVNRYFVGKGYSGLNINQKPWCEGPYGRDRIFVGEKFTNRNALTTDSTGHLLTQIALKKAVSPSRSDEMLELLRRDPTRKSVDPDDQSHGFIAGIAPTGTKIWSKAGWTSTTRHDAAYMQLPNGTEMILVIFTVNHANNRAILQHLARSIIEAQTAR